MRQKLQYLYNDVARIDYDNIYEAIEQLKRVLCTAIELLDEALPKEVEPD